MEEKIRHGNLGGSDSQIQTLALACLLEKIFSTDSGFLSMKHNKMDVQRTFRLDLQLTQHVGTMKMMLIDGLFLVQLLDNCELGEVVCTKEHKLNRLGLPNTSKSTQLHNIFVQLPELL